MRDPNRNPTAYVWLFKIDETNGNLNWQKTYGPFDEEGSGPLLTAGADGYLLSKGSCCSSGTYTTLIKTDSEGNVVWKNVYSSTSISAIEKTSEGGYVLGGHTFPNHDFPYYGRIAVLDSDGNIIWQNTYRTDAGGGGDILSVQETSDRGFVVAGVRSWVEYANATWLSKLDSSGNIVWERTLDKKSIVPLGVPIIPTSDNGFVVLLSDRTSFTVLKLDLLGQGCGSISHSALPTTVVESQVETVTSQTGEVNLQIHTESHVTEAIVGTAIAEVDIICSQASQS